MGSTNAVVALAGGKLSKVVHAMCDGLLVAADRDDFYVDMNTFGDTADFGAPNNECCYGCAATCTLMRLTGVQLTTRTITGHSNHATAVGLPVKDVSEFERAVDAFRCGDDGEWSTFWNLAELCNTPFEVVGAALDHSGPWALANSDWREQLPVLRSFASYLADRGY